MNNKIVGKNGEEKAVNYLIAKEHFIIERNYRCVFGEIDIITFFQSSIYIYEVKFRQSLEYGYGDDAIDSRKINKIRKTFEQWLSENERKYKFNNIYLNALIIDPDGTINEFEIL